MNNIGQKPKTRKKGTLSLLGHMECVVFLSRKQREENADREQLKCEIRKQLAPITKKFGIPRSAAFLFCHILEICGNREATPQRLAASLRCSHIRFLKYMDCLDTLVQKGLVYQSKNHRCADISYVVPYNVIQSIRRGVVPVPRRFHVDEPEELFKYMDEIFGNRIDGKTSYEYFRAELYSLLEDNVHLEFCRLINEYKMNDANNILFLFMCRQLASGNDDSFDLGRDQDDALDSIFGSYLMDELMFSGIFRQIKKGKGCLFEKELVEFVNNHGFRGTKSIQITDKTKDRLFAGVDLTINHSEKRVGLIEWKEVKEKKLFYNAEEAASIDRLAGLLGSENYSAIVNRLGENNMRTGFACLFSGPPGTGKTETAYQLAKITGRDIMPVDIAGSKSMWFGESEKIIKGIFSRYRHYAEQAEKAKENIPILLFNEADALISKRRELSASRSGPDQTENAMQNIILEEMEKLNGILIATTNLTQNMDAAFERRFLFKIDFAKPSLETRMHIWQSLVPALSPEDCGSLAGAFDLSGGQIENIARKYTVETVLTGAAPSLCAIMSFCREETIGRNNQKIGFAV